jgi:hypothetical protein
MAGELVVLDGSTFFQDVRDLAHWSLSVNGAPMRVLTSEVVDYGGRWTPNPSLPRSMSHLRLRTTPGTRN